MQFNLKIIKFGKRYRRERKNENSMTFFLTATNIALMVKRIAL